MAVGPAGGVEGARVEVVDTRWSVVADANGRFELSLPGGSWLLTAHRVGYRSDTAGVELPVDPEAGLLRIRMTPDPVQLGGIDVSERPTGSRVSPTRTLTSETLRQAPPLAEPDVLRALVYLPEVTQPNDLKAGFHLAGGASDETGYRLDGHPVQRPFHLLGLLGGFNVASIQEVDVHVHRLPIGTGDHLSGVVALETKRGEGEALQEGTLSMLSGSFTTLRPELPLGMDFLVSGRMSYLDRVAHRVFPDVPRLGFHDALVRLGRSWDGAWRTELLGFSSGNEFRGGDVKEIEPRRPLSWGESLLGVSLRRSGMEWDLALRGSVNRMSTELDERPEGTNLIDTSREWWSSEVIAERRGESWQASVGATLDHLRDGKRWIAEGLADEIFSPNTPTRFRDSETLTKGAVFGEMSLDVGSRSSVSTGGRLVRAGGNWHLAPRLSLGHRASDAVRFEASAERRIQFEAQLEEPIEGSVSPPTFLLETPRRATVYSATLDWLPRSFPVGDNARVRTGVFWKDYPDRPVLVDATSRSSTEPAASSPGQADEAFPDFRRIPGRAFGMTTSLRFRFGDGGVFQGSYAYQRAQERVDGVRSPTTWDTPHNVTFFSSLPLGPGWSLNAAFRAHSGRAATPVRARVFIPSRTFGLLRSRFLRGERNSARVGAYRRLDLALRHRWRWMDADWTFFAQALNVLGASNPIGYDWLQFYRDRTEGRDGEGLGGLPRVPSLGLEVRW